MDTVTLRQARMVRGMSLATMARRANLNPESVRYIETGKRTPRPETMQRLADVLGMEIADVAEFRRAIFGATPVAVD